MMILMHHVSKLRAMMNRLMMKAILSFRWREIIYVLYSEEEFPEDCSVCSHCMGYSLWETMVTLNQRPKAWYLMNCGSLSVQCVPARS